MKITGYNLGRQCFEEIEVSIAGVMEDQTSGKEWPILGLKMMDDEKWNRLCEEQERKHPELYAEMRAEVCL